MNLCGRSCKRCVYFNRCGGCSFCEASVCRYNCKYCGTLCLKRGEAVVFSKKIIKDIKLIGNSEYDIDFHIPIIPDKLKECFDYSNFFGVHGGNALKSNGKGFRKAYKNSIFETLNIDSKCRGILEFYVKDRTLEGIWDNRETFYKEISNLNISFVIAPNFSVYEDAPRLEHLINISRSLIIYNEMIQRGIKAIPDVSWYNINDLNFWVNLINESKCKVIAFSFQVVDVRLKASNLWKNYLAGFRYLCNRIEHKLKVIIAGINSYERIREIRIAAGNNVSLHILNQSAYIQSQRGMYSRNRCRDIDTPKELLFKKNVDYFNYIYSSLNERR